MNLCLKYWEVLKVISKVLASETGRQKESDKKIVSVDAVVTGGQSTQWTQAKVLRQFLDKEKDNFSKVGLLAYLAFLLMELKVS